jgi:hypothetical protein
VELAETQLEPASDHLSHQVIFFLGGGRGEVGAGRGINVRKFIFFGESMFFQQKFVTFVKSK